VDPGPLAGWISRGLPILLVLVPCVAMSCRRVVDIEVRGDLDQGVRFRFFEAGDPAQAISGERVRVLVAESYGESVWQLDGAGTVPELRYGRATLGFEETVEARPLQAGRRYYVQAEGWARGGAYAEGTCVFSIDEAGKVAPEDGC
jgi:hypothetical protein